MEAGPVSAKQKGSSRVVFQAISGFDFEGGHLEDRGLSPDGDVIAVPLHSHQVSLDFTRLEFEYDYTFKTNWDVWFRLPFEIKSRSASVQFIDPVTPSEREAIERNADLHHRSNTLTGFSDLKVLLAHRIVNLFREGDGLDFAFGTSLPIGSTEEDPFTAADEGLGHEHLQFGTGTFDPLLEMYYSTPISSSFTLGVFGIGRFPFYENSKRFEGPTEITSEVSLLYGVSDRVKLQFAVVGFYQGFAHWSGVRDINSGLRSLSVKIGAAFVTQQGTVINFALRQPTSQETFDDDGDTFEQGATILFSVSRRIMRKS